jgi:predicted RNA-binding protein
MNKKILNEGLRPSDLQNLVKPMIEIDSYKSKMGEDRDVCVLNFHVLDRMPARDLMEFIEKGFNSVLDADVSAGENSKGEYHVFVEFTRTPKLPEQIEQLLYGVSKLTDVTDWKFRYHKSDKVQEVSEENIKSIVPLSPRLYEDNMRKFKVEEIKSFFSKTLMDDLNLEDNIITIHKPFDQKIKLRWLKEEDPQSIVEGAPSMDESSTAEIFWMTKVLGDYDITKFGDKFLFTNGHRAMLLQRIEQ